MKAIQANSDGWTDWQFPVLEKYRLGCCDCGLVHDFDFRVVKVTKRNSDGSCETRALRSKDYCIEFRVRRNNRSTGQIRRRQ